MYRYAMLLLLSLTSVLHAEGGTLRVGNQVLSVGDSAARVVELLGKPSYKSHTTTTAARGKAKSSTTRGRSKTTSPRATGGEQWQYRHGDRVTSIIIANGKISAIEDHSF